MRLFKITHIYCEENLVADYLAAQAWKADFTIFAIELVCPQLADLLVTDAREICFER